MKIETLFSRNSDEWETPLEIYASLDAEFHFTLDPCATADNHKCDTYYTAEDNGLTKNWGGAKSILQSPIFADRNMGRKGIL